MFVVGLTGGIGSGKTAVSDFFAKQGICVVDADVISHAVTAKGSPVLDELCLAFGDWVVVDGELDRVALRQYVFKNPDALAKLNAITHPMIRQRICDAIGGADSDYVILSAPLLLESIKGDDKGLTAFCQRILVVDVPPDVQRQRASRRDGQSLDDIQKIMDKQIDRQTRLALADDVVDNTGDLAFLYQQLAELHRQYLAMAQ